MEVLAACHIHSSWSYDGMWGLDRLSSTFADRGYRVLMTTEHDQGFTQDRFAEYRAACGRVTSDRIHVVPGIEYSDSANRVHVLVWGAVPFLGEGLSTETVLAGVARHKGVAVLAHPSRKAAWQCFNPEWAEHLLGIEVWNRKYDGWVPSTHAAGLLDQNTAVPFVGLDFHSQRQLFPLAMALQIDGAVNERSVVDALRNRRAAARAFGRPLDAPQLQRRLRLMQFAERGRRQLGALKRYAKTRTRR